MTAVGNPGGTAIVRASPVGGTARPATSVTVIEVVNQGDGGDAAGFIAKSAVSGDKALMFLPDGTVAHADPTRTHYVYAGIALNSAQAGGRVQAKRDGILSAPFWSWIFGEPVFTAPEGNLTQVPPEVGFSHIVAFAIGATSLRLVDDDLILIGDT